MKISLQLSKKNIGYINWSIEKFSIPGTQLLIGEVIQTIKSGSYEEEDLVSFEISDALFITIWDRVGMISESICSQPHRNLRNALLPQLVALSNSVDLEIAEAANNIMQFVANKDAASTNWFNECSISGLNSMLGTT